MAEEFNEILKSLNKKSLEEKVEIILETFGNVCQIILKIPKMVDVKLNTINQKINTLEFRINKIDEQLLRQKQPKESTPLPPPSPPPSIKNISQNYQDAGTKAAVMGELNALFKKRKEMDKK